jgi:hypothetical protein
MRSKKRGMFLEGLGRRVGNRRPKARFILFCEGKNTEPEYFDYLRRTVRDALVEVSIVGAVGTPFTIATKATERRKDAQRSPARDSFEKYDRYWAVFDRDEHPKFKEAVQLCEQNGVEVARSNPCFEVWLILHIQDYDKPCSRHDAQRHLGSIHKPYKSDKRKLVDSAVLVASIELAEKRAKKQCDRRKVEGSEYSAPSTTVGILTNAIRNAGLRSQEKKTISELKKKHRK